MPKSLKERLEWLYKTDPVFKAEKDILDNIEKKIKEEKLKREIYENSYRHTKTQK